MDGSSNSGVSGGGMGNPRQQLVLRDQLLALADAVVTLPETDPGRIATADLLRVAVCRLTQLFVPNAHQKLGEIVYAADHPEYTVSDETTGADLVSVDGTRAREHKVSKISKGRCNFNWNLPGDKSMSDDTRRPLVLRNVANKVYDGDVALVVTSRSGATLREFTMSGRFVMEYFARLPLAGVSTKHNMGCTQCRVCSAFHRLVKLEDASRTLSEMAPDTTLSRAQWAAVFKPTASDCVLRKNPRERAPKRKSGGRV